MDTSATPPLTIFIVDDNPVDVPPHPLGAGCPRASPTNSRSSTMALMRLRSWTHLAQQEHLWASTIILLDLNLPNAMEATLHYLQRSGVVVPKQRDRR
jgi:hypothetical protein